MILKLNKNQKEVLEYLLDTYENSKTYKGENVRNQSFAVKPEKIFHDYNGDFADVDEVKQFNRDILILEEKNFVVLQKSKKTNEIRNIVLNLEMLQSIYEILGREDITKRRNAEISLYKQYQKIHPIIDAFCEKQIERLRNFKNAEYESKIAENILKLLRYVLTNQSGILERELSIAVLGDTKLFKDSYKTRICKIIETYGMLEVDLDAIDKKEKESVILEEFRVYSNPSYVFFKGNVTIRYSYGNVVTATSNCPIAISSESIGYITEVRIRTNRIITVENLTSYNRVNDDNAVFLFLSGYHNTVKQKFLMKIAKDNQDVKWYHFGDIDPDGYYILKNLIEKTGILFEPVNMGKEQLIKYEKYCKKLEKNDVVKAESLKKSNFYGEVIEFMQKHNCKLEQEIISWLE